VCHTCETSLVSGEVTYFRNDVRDFVFRRQLSADEFASQQAAFAERFPSRELPEPDGEFPIVENVAADSVLQGIEAHADVRLSSRVTAEVGADYVHGADGYREFLPRMPPFRAGKSVRYSGTFSRR
jgi:outer membrane receptor for ferrienterochelin and colicin